MDAGGSNPNGQTVKQSHYSIDSLINAYASMNDEEKELDRKSSSMIISSVDTVYSDPSICSSFPMPFGLIIQPFSRSSERVLQVEQSPVRCVKCGAIATSMSVVDSEKVWKCVFCGETNPTPFSAEQIGANGGDTPSSLYPELSECTQTVDYINVANDTNNIYSPTSESVALIFVIDKSLSAAQFEHIQKSMATVFSSSSVSQYYIGLIVFGDVIEIYEMGGSIGEADVFASSHMPDLADEQYIRMHERGVENRYEDVSQYAGYLSPLNLQKIHFLEILGTFQEKDETIHPISFLTFLAATRYAQLLFGTGAFSSGQIVVCTSGFFYDRVSDPYLHFDGANEWVNTEISRQSLFCYQNHLVIDTYLNGCMYNSITTLKSLIIPSGGQLLLLGDSYQTDFINCLYRSFFSITSNGSITVYIGEGVEVDRVLGNFMTSSVQRYCGSTIVKVDFGRMFESSSISILYHTVPHKKVEDYAIPIQAEVSFRNEENGRYIVRREFCELGETSDYSEFLRNVDGYVTSVLIAKDLSSNLRVNPVVTKQVKSSIDYLLCQILRFYKMNYLTTEYSATLPAVSASKSKSSVTLSSHSAESSFPLSHSVEEPVLQDSSTTTASISPILPKQTSLTTPAPLLSASSSYSSFYSYTRSISHGDMTTIIDPFDTIPTHSVYSNYVTESEAQAIREEKGSMWDWFISLITSPISLFSSSPAKPVRTAHSSLNPILPHSLRMLPLYLYSLQRGCLFGEGLHNTELLQLHRLRMAAANLQDSLRIILPRLILACDMNQRTKLHRIRSVPMTSPPPNTHVSRGNGSVVKGHRRGSGVCNSGPVVYRSDSKYIPSVSSGDLANMQSEVLLEEGSSCGSHEMSGSGNMHIPYISSTAPSPYATSVQSPFPFDGTPSVQGSMLFSSSRSAIDVREIDSLPQSAYEEEEPDDENENEYEKLVEDGGVEGSEYYLKKKYLQPPAMELPEFFMMTPETMALLSDSVVVLDTQREVFVWIGALRKGMKEDSVYSSCLSLALSITKKRNPPPLIRIIDENSSDNRFVLCNLIPSHKDPLDMSLQSLPILSTLPPDMLKRHCAKFLRTDDMSFREYMAKIYQLR